MNRATQSGATDAEAAAWVARLQNEARDDATEAGFQAWLATEAAHREAFERATEVWAMLPGAALCADAGRETPPPARRQPPRGRPPLPRPVLALAASLVLLLGFGALWWALGGSPGYATSVGEQKVATLDDGSRIALNTDTLLDVDFSPSARRVRLERGEAMFEVAPDAARPFIVSAGSKRVRAIGTVFLVRHEGGTVTVTLIEGKVAVSDEGRPVRTAPAQLSPGERLVAPADGPALIQPESVEAATAWRRGQALFRDTPLASAVAELNRYGGPQLAVDDPRVAALPVSGVFATNQTAEFAEAVAALHGLHVRKQGATLHIVR